MLPSIVEGSNFLDLLASMHPSFFLADEPCVCYGARVPRRWSVWSSGCAIVAFAAASSGCKAPVATAAECDTVAQHLADLQIKKEKTPPFGHLVPPFDDAAHQQELETEAKTHAKERCTKGWKREVYDCMMQSQDLDAADKCRFL